MNVVEDVILKAPLYGIHHPISFHSFCNASFAQAALTLSMTLFLPSNCIACGQIVIPLVNSCICLRCRCLAHRTCIRHVQNKCVAAVFQGLEPATSMFQAAENTSDEISVQHELNSIVLKACLIPKVLVNFVIIYAY